MRNFFLYTLGLFLVILGISCWFIGTQIDNNLNFQKQNLSTTSTDSFFKLISYNKYSYFVKDIYQYQLELDIDKLASLLSEQTLNSPILDILQKYKGQQLYLNGNIDSLNMPFGSIQHTAEIKLLKNNSRQELPENLQQWLNNLLNINAKIGIWGISVSNNVTPDLQLKFNDLYLHISPISINTYMAYNNTDLKLNTQIPFTLAVNNQESSLKIENILFNLNFAISPDFNILQPLLAMDFSTWKNLTNFKFKIISTAQKIAWQTKNSINPQQLFLETPTFFADLNIDNNVSIKLIYNDSYSKINNIDTALNLDLNITANNPIKEISDEMLTNLNLLDYPYHWLYLLANKINTEIKINKLTLNPQLLKFSQNKETKPIKLDGNLNLDKPQISPFVKQNYPFLLNKLKLNLNLCSGAEIKNYFLIKYPQLKPFLSKECILISLDNNVIKINNQILNPLILLKQNNNKGFFIDKF